MNSVNQPMNQPIDISKMGVFSGINRLGNLDNCDDIVRLTGDKSLTFDKTKTCTNWMTRTDADREANNQTRAELLKSLGAALGVTKGVTAVPQTDKITKKRTGEVRLKFSEEFITDLKGRLGTAGVEALKFSAFGLNDKGGYVTSGKPLTERRVTLVNRFLSRHQGLNANPTDNNMTIQNIVRQRFSQETIAAFKDNLSSPEQRSNMFNYLCDLLPSALDTNQFSADVVSLQADLITLGDQSEQDPFKLDKTFSEINRLVAKHNVLKKIDNTENAIPFFTPDSFFGSLKTAETKLANEAQSLIDLIEEQNIELPTVPDSNGNQIAIKTINIENAGYTMISKIADAVEMTFQTKIVENAIKQIKAAHDKISPCVTRVQGNPATKLDNLLSGLKKALGEKKTYYNGQVDDKTMPELSFTTGEVKTVLNKFKISNDCLNLSDLCTLCKEALLKIKENTDTKTNSNIQSIDLGGISEALQNALLSLQPLLIHIGGGGDENLDIVRELSDVAKIQPQVPDEAPQYPSTASYETKASANLYSTYKLLGDQFPYGNYLLQAALTSAKKGQRESPDAVDFLTCIFKNAHMGAVQSCFSLIFGPILANRAVSAQHENKRDNLSKDLRKNIINIIATQIKSIEKNTSANTRDKLFDEITKGITQALNDNESIKKLKVNFNTTDVKRALVAGLHIHLGIKADTLRQLNDVLARKGGGLISIHKRKVTFNNKDFQSVVTPKNQVLHQHGIAVPPNEPPLTNLALSEIKDDANDGKTLIAFNRFGVVGTDWEKPDEIKTHYRQLAIQTFLANPTLLEKVRKGDTTPVDLPIWRIDLADNNFLDENKIKKDGTLEDVTFTMKDANDKDITVTLKPTVHHFHMPIDSRPKTNEALIDRDFADDNKKALEALLDSAKKLQRTLPENDKKRKAIETLSRQIEEGFDKIKDLELPLPEDPDDIAKLQYGPKLTYLGSRIAVLTSLLGNVPSINCNWGRDRTTGMDNESKTVALKVHDYIEDREQKLALEKFPDGTDADPAEVQLRTRLLVETGNWDIARETNCTIHDINLQQCGYTDETKKKTFSGFDTLFDTSKVVDDSYVD